MKLRATLATLTAIALLSPSASADESHHILSPGFLWGVSKQLNDAPAWGALGGELVYAYVWKPEETFVGIGAFTQVQTVGFHHLRAAVGPQVTYSYFGLELGPYVETGKDIYATTVGLQASPFVTVGVLSAAFRAGIPLATTSEGTRYGVDLGAVFTLKLPFSPSSKVGYIPIAWMFLVRE
jgi:hypothetical protein